MDLRRMIGKRIEIPMYYNMWIRGVKYGTVTQYRRGKPGCPDYVYVKMDSVHKRLKLYRPDWEYTKLIDG